MAKWCDALWSDLVSIKPPTESDSVNATLLYKAVLIKAS